MPVYARLIKEISSFVKKARQRNDEVPMTLATSSPDGQPSVRVVLLKEVGEEGFVFFTNTRSRKGRQITKNPHAALSFFWPDQNIQLSVEGRLAPVSDSEADAYWVTRPRKSQIGAWASQQSQPLSSRTALLKDVARVWARFRGGDVPRPAHWTGFRLSPDRIEIWKRGAFRLHHRRLFVKKDGRWSETLLYP